MQGSIVDAACMGVTRWAGRSLSLGGVWVHAQPVEQLSRAPSSIAVPWLVMEAQPAAPQPPGQVWAGGMHLGDSGVSIRA